MKVLMVCLGNICRSPLAQGILESKVNTNDVFVDSAGTSGWHNGKLADSRSIAVADKNGLDITNQRSRKFVVEDFDSFDLIYAMDKSNLRDILSLARSQEDIAKVKLILNEISIDNKDVPDPYYGEGDGFIKVYNMLDEACEIIASKIN